MAKAPTGEAIVLNVAALAAPGTRAPVTGVGLKKIVGTTTGYQIGEQELSTREFGTMASTWDDGAVISKSWQIPLQTNYRPEVEANALIETTGLTLDELYVELFPFGAVSGKPKFIGYCTVNGLTVGLPRDGLQTMSCTLQGRGPLTRSTI